MLKKRTLVYITLSPSSRQHLSLFFLSLSVVQLFPDTTLTDMHLFFFVSLHPLLMPLNMTDCFAVHVLQQNLHFRTAKFCLHFQRSKYSAAKRTHIVVVVVFCFFYKRNQPLKSDMKHKSMCLKVTGLTMQSTVSIDSQSCALYGHHPKRPP